MSQGPIQKTAGSPWHPRGRRRRWCSGFQRGGSAGGWTWPDAWGQRGTAVSGNPTPTSTPILSDCRRLCHRVSTACLFNFHSGKSPAPTYPVPGFNTYQSIATLQTLGLCNLISKMLWTHSHRNNAITYVHMLLLRYHTLSNILLAKPPFSFVG